MQNLPKWFFRVYNSSDKTIVEGIREGLKQDVIKHLADKGLIVVSMRELSEFEFNSMKTGILLMNRISNVKKKRKPTIIEKTASFLHKFLRFQ